MAQAVHRLGAPVLAGIALTVASLGGRGDDVHDPARHARGERRAARRRRRSRRRPRLAHGRARSGLRRALPAAPVRVSAAVRRRGAARILAYRASGVGSGTTVRAYERGRGISRPLGTLRNGAGTLRLRSDEGRGGPRSIVAIVERRAPVARPRIALARYVAPGARPPAAPRGARARLKSGRLTVTWGRVPGVAGYLVKATLRDGRVLVRTPRARRVVIRGLGTAAKVRSVTVSARSRVGLTGPGARAR